MNHLVLKIPIVFFIWTNFWSNRLNNCERHSSSIKAIASDLIARVTSKNCDMSAGCHGASERTMTNRAATTTTSMSLRRKCESVAVSSQCDAIKTTSLRMHHLTSVAFDMFMTEQQHHNNLQEGDHNQRRWRGWPQSTTMERVTTLDRSGVASQPTHQHLVALVNTRQTSFTAAVKDFSS